MIKVLENMPPGTVGLQADGRVTEMDYDDVLVPALSEAIETGEVRLLYLLGEDFDSYSVDAVWSDAKFVTFSIKNRDAWKKLAIVSDNDWVENGVKALTWLMPGEVEVFDTDDLHDAKAWLVDLGTHD